MGVKNDKKVGGVKNWSKKKNQNSWKKSGCEKQAASELLFGLGVNDPRKVERPQKGLF